jgi:hypothetical protein
MSGGTERKYALTKVASGDYLLPSNDGKSLWRIRVYTEGPSSGLEDWPADRDVWGVWKWTEMVCPGSYADTENESEWDFWEGLYETRKSAINAALKAGGA